MGPSPITYAERMTRWQANPRERLARTALELFAERGYDPTTVTDIAERAGLTKSTFFRHFADKREVLFGGRDEMVDLIAESVAAATPGTSPWECVTAALHALGRFFPADQRPFTATRAAVIAAHPELRERELLKGTQLTTAITNALRARDIDDVTARLTATIGMLAFELAYERWATATTATATTFDHQIAAAVAELTARCQQL
jgi:AcrR family transcriptional regulator